jgi:hypothetical protein
VAAPYYDRKGVRHSGGAFPSKSEAWNHYRDVVEPELLGRPAARRDLTLTQLVDAFLERHTATPRTITTLRGRLSRPLDKFGTTPLADLEHAAVSPIWRQWAQESLLPKVYWEHQVTRTRCARRKAKRQRALEGVQATFATHALTQCLPPQALGDWYTWATRQVQAFQRASSAVEGRNSYLAQRHHNQRGLPKQRYKVWAVLHNFDGRASDGTTPATRFFRRSFPDLFETVLAHIAELPRPRQRKRVAMLRH